MKTLVTHVIRVLKIYQECDLIQHTIDIVQRAFAGRSKFELLTVRLVGETSTYHNSSDVVLASVRTCFKRKLFLTRDALAQD